MEIPKMELPKMELPKVELAKLKMPSVERPKFGLPDIDLPEIKLGRLDTDAIGRLIAERLPGRPPRPRLRLRALAVLGLVAGLGAVAWVALARAAAPLRASLGGLAQQTRTRLPTVVDDLKRRTGQLVYRTGDVIEHAGDEMEPAGEQIGRTDQP